MTGQAFAQAMAALDEVNGPEDRPRKQDAHAEWDAIGWRAQEGQVRRLRQRMLTATLFALDPAALRVHVSAWLGGDRWWIAGWGR
jgi:hypothetical protein